MTSDLLQRCITALYDAKTEIAQWGVYAPEYFQQKWNLTESVNKFDSLIEELQAALKEEVLKQPTAAYAVLNTEGRVTEVFRTRARAESYADYTEAREVKPLHF